MYLKNRAKAKYEKNASKKKIKKQQIMKAKKVKRRRDAFDFL